MGSDTECLMRKEEVGQEVPHTFQRCQVDDDDDDDAK